MISILGAALVQPKKHPQQVLTAPDPVPAAAPVEPVPAAAPVEDGAGGKWQSGSSGQGSQPFFALF